MLRETPPNKTDRKTFWRRLSLTGWLILAAIGVTLATIARLLMIKHLGFGISYSLILAVLVPVIWFGGLWPGIFASVTYGLLLFWVYPQPMPSQSPDQIAFDARILAYAFLCFLMSAFGESMRRTRLRAEAAADEAESNAIALKRSEAELRMVTDSLPVLVSYVDKSLCYRFANKTYEHWFGDRGRNLVGKHVKTLLGSQLFEDLLPSIQRALDGDIVSFEKRLPGELADRYVRVVLIPRHTPEGQSDGFLTMISDLTDLQRADAERSQLLALERRRSRQLQLINEMALAINREMPLEQLLEIIAQTARVVFDSRLATVAILKDSEKAPSTPDEFALDSESIRLSAVANAEQQWQPRQINTLGVLLDSYIGPSTEMKVSHVNHQHLLESSQAEAYFAANPFNPQPTAWTVIPLISIQGHRMGLLQLCERSEDGVFTLADEAMATQLALLAARSIETHDLFISERVARNQAERANRMKDDFLSTLSHELRTPMNSILGWAQILNSSDCSEEDLKKGLETIERSASIQSQLVSDLLDMSRIISGKIRLDVEPVQIRQIVESAIASVRPSLEEKRLTMDTNLATIIGPMTGDSARLQQVVLNLLTNAVKFTPAGGRITIVLKQTGAYCEISITDTGIGIKPDFKPYVFDRFIQADASITKRYGGMGLGLAIVKQLVELHGGQAKVESDGEGKGATFTILLPPGPPAEVRAESPAIVTRPKKSQTALPDLSGTTILIVDDDQDSRMLLQRILNQTKASIHLASSAEEGLQFFANQPPHLLISDIGMPRMDGYQFIKKVRELDPSAGGSVPAIALTAFARTEDKDRAINAGFQKHLTKPIDWRGLMTAVSQLTHV